jgi:tellurium resistance protein TerD
MHTAMIFGEIYRYQGEWKFRAVGQGYKGGLAELVRLHGVEA